jgi:RimJ/RimL family protein N-acetyltransferase
MERIGMRREALFIQAAYEKGAWTDELHYAILADEWRAARVSA